MKIVNPSVEIITETDPLKRIEICGRVCYKSEKKITGKSAPEFVKKIIKSGHTSVLEHARIKVDFEKHTGEAKSIFLCRVQPYRVIYHDCGTKPFGGYWSINARDYLAIFPKATVEDIGKHELLTDEYLTVRFVCDRAIANELVRHRVFSFSQESTRYCNYRDGLTFVRPVPFVWSVPHTESKPLYDRYTLWFNAMANAEITYRTMVASGMTPQEARSVLPLSTKTELVMSGLLEQWRDLLKLRLDPAAHPQMYELMQILVSKVPSLIKPPF